MEEVPHDIVNIMLKYFYPINEVYAFSQNKKKKKKKKGKNTFLVLIFWGVFILVPKIYNVFI